MALSIAKKKNSSMIESELYFYKKTTRSKSFVSQIWK